MPLEMSNIPAGQKSIFLMALCSALWSIAGILVKMIPWNPIVIAGFRSLLAAGIIVIYMAVKHIPIKCNRVSVLAGLMLCLTFMGFMTANKLTTAANAIVLQYTSPVFIILLSVLFLKQRFHKTDYIVVATTLLGISLCFLGQFGAGSLAGNLIGLCCGLTLAAMFTITGNTDRDSRMSGLLFGQIMTAVIGLCVVPFVDTPVSAPAVISILLLGIFQLGIPYVLYGVAVEHCPPLMCCLISAIEPLLNPVWVFLFDGETPGVFSIIGGVIVIGTITVWSIWNGRKAAQGTV